MDRNVNHFGVCVAHKLSLSARRAWIEILIPQHTRNIFPSLSARRAWIEICFARSLIAEGNGSLSARRAWIEMMGLLYRAMPRFVALRKESVDRNPVNKKNKQNARVALRKESVDRNVCQVGIAAQGFGRSPQGERG